MMNKQEIQKKLIMKAVKMASSPDDYDDYQKGFVAGQIYVLKKLLDEEKVVTVVTADSDSFKVD